MDKEKITSEMLEVLEHLSYDKEHNAIITDCDIIFSYTKQANPDKDSPDNERDI